MLRFQYLKMLFEEICLLLKLRYNVSQSIIIYVSPDFSVVILR